MPAYNFKLQFAESVENGSKRQTIRRRRLARPTRIGDRLYLYTGLRRPGARLLRTATCLSVEPITMRGSVWKLDGIVMTPSEQEELARADGFEDAREMRDWFERQYGSLFKGEVIKW